jgi:Tol biopolymer transport system component
LNPVWSPDGRWLYYLSNRSGSMNLWRISIDEATGVPHGAPQPLSAPESYVRSFTLSADGRTGSYATVTFAARLSRIRFNLQTATIEGVAQRLTTGSRDFGLVEVSPSGQQVLLSSSFFQQEDLYLLTPDGSGFMSLTNDSARDRGPRFSRDGRRVFFYRDQEGTYDVWSINVDGSGLRRLTSAGGYYPLPSPDGGRLLVANINSFGLFVIDANDPEKAPEGLPPLPTELRGSNFIPQDWSPDGKTILGASFPHAWIYSFETKQYREVVGASSLLGTDSLQWFADTRRVLGTRQGRVVVADTTTGQSRDVFAVPGEVIFNTQFSSDGWLYLLSGNVTGDVWVVRFDDATQPAGQAGDKRKQ